LNNHVNNLTIYFRHYTMNIFIGDASAQPFGDKNARLYVLPMYYGVCKYSRKVDPGSFPIRIEGKKESKRGDGGVLVGFPSAAMLRCWAPHMLAA
jgi:hypothetical protein